MLSLHSFSYLVIIFNTLHGFLLAHYFITLSYHFSHQLIKITIILKYCINKAGHSVGVHWII